MVGYVAGDLYWGRIGRVVRFRCLDVYLGLCDRVCSCRSLLGKLWQGMGRYISTGDGVVD